MQMQMHQAVAPGLFALGGSPGGVRALLWILVQDSRYRTGGGASDDAGTGGFAPQSPAFTICQVGDEWSDPCVAKVPAQYGMAHAGQGARSQVTAERVRGASVGDCLGGLASAV